MREFAFPSRTSSAIVLLGSFGQGRGDLECSWGCWSAGRSWSGPALLLECVDLHMVLVDSLNVLESAGRIRFSQRKAGRRQSAIKVPLISACPYYSEVLDLPPAHVHYHRWTPPLQLKLIMLTVIVRVSVTNQCLFSLFLHPAPPSSSSSSSSSSSFPCAACSLASLRRYLPPPCIADFVFNLIIFSSSNKKGPPAASPSTTSTILLNKRNAATRTVNTNDKSQQKR